MNVVKSLRRKWSNYCKPKNRRHTCPPVWGGSCRDHDTGREDCQIEEVVASTFIKSIEK